MALRHSEVRDLPAEARSSRGLDYEAGSGFDWASSSVKAEQATDATGAIKEGSPAEGQDWGKRTPTKTKVRSTAGNHTTPRAAGSKRTRSGASKGVSEGRRTQEAKAETDRRTGTMSGGGGKKGAVEEHPRRGWLHGSPLAIITLALTLALNVGQFGYIYASILGQIDFNRKAIERLETTSRDSVARNEKDDRERYNTLSKVMDERTMSLAKAVEDRHSTTVRMIEERNGILTKSIDRLDTSINNMLQLKTDVEVMKNKLTGIDETLRRVERSWERSDSRAIGIPPNGGHHHMGRAR